jgi:tetratricopeptide (TPR) repeat protein
MSDQTNAQRQRLKRETLVMGGTCVLLGLLFFTTAVAVHAYKIRTAELSREWADAGQRELAAGHPEDAIEDLRNALAYDAQNPDYQFHLAQALNRAGKSDEARAYLLHLWQEEPGSGLVNLELARLAARKSETDEALRFFHNAIYGVWEDAPEENRREVRSELISFLLQQKRPNQADAELIALVPSLPNEASAYVRAGKLFLQAGDLARAMEQFRHALRLAPANGEALAGAGTAAYSLGDLRLAEPYLKRAAVLEPRNADVAAMLETLQAAHQLDPFGFRLSRVERASRVKAAFQTAMQRLQTCMSEKPAAAAQMQAQLAAGNMMEEQIGAPRYLDSPDAVESTMNFVFDSESLAEKSCPAGQTADKALELITRARESR